MFEVTTFVQHCHNVITILTLFDNSVKMDDVWMHEL